MRRVNSITALLAVALLVAAVPSSGQDGGPDDRVAELKDVIHGTITVPGGSLSVVLYAPAGTKLKLKVGKDGKEDPGVTLSLDDPDGSPVALENGKATLERSGWYSLAMTAAAGRTGKFLLTVKGKPPASAKFKGVVDDEVEQDVTFGVMPSTSLDYSLGNANVGSLFYTDDPEVYDQPLYEKKVKGLLLKEPGDYTFRMRGTGQKAKLSLTFKSLKIRKRDVWLSEDGFGTEPDIDSLDPAEGLNTGPVTDVEIEGGPFDPAARVWLEKKGVVIDGTVRWESEDRILADFDLTGASKGKWKLWVENPSGASAKAKFQVIKASELPLPDGVKEGTEVWYVEFTDRFDEDLAEFGLAGPSDAVNRRASSVVQAYVIYNLRTLFGLPGKTGNVKKENVPICFIVDEVPTVGGTVGVDYNRIQIGGPTVNALTDNPSLLWGFVAVDAGNQFVDDISDDNAASARLPTAEMSPTKTAATTAAFRDVFAPLIALPVRDTDAIFFANNPRQYLTTNETILRYGDVVTAIEVLSREIAAVAAHHIARAMGIENGDTGVMATPARFGEFSADLDLAFETTEMEDLWDNAEPNVLPGRAYDLKILPFQMNTGQRVLIEMFGGVTSEYPFFPTGGRPGKKPADMFYQLYLTADPGPLGVQWKSDGRLVGFPPVYSSPGFFYTDAVYLTVIAIDTVDGTQVGWRHRLNILVDTTGLTGAVLADALFRNQQTREGPAR